MFAPAPLSGVVAKDVPRLAPPGRAVVRAQTREAVGIVPDLGAAEIVSDATSVQEDNDDCNGDARDREPAEHASDELSPLRLERPKRNRSEGRQRTPGEEQQTEPGTVGDAIRARERVLDQCGPREGPGSDQTPRHDGDEREQRGIDPVAAEPEPQRDSEQSRSNSCP